MFAQEPYSIQLIAVPGFGEYTARPRRGHTVGLRTTSESRHPTEVSHATIEQNTCNVTQRQLCSCSVLPVRDCGEAALAPHTAARHCNCCLIRICADAHLVVAGYLQQAGSMWTSELPQRGAWHCRVTH